MTSLPSLLQSTLRPCSAAVSNTVCQLSIDEMSLIRRYFKSPVELVEYREVVGRTSDSDYEVLSMQLRRLWLLVRIFAV